MFAFWKARLDDEALWATEASRSDDDLVPDGAHWQWVDDHTDEAIDPSPGIQTYVDDDVEGGISLRSQEEFPSSAGRLPQFAIHTADTVPAAVGGHIIRHDPARVLNEVTAKRQRLARGEVVVDRI